MTPARSRTPDAARLRRYALEVGFWELDLEAGRFWVSPEWEEMVGYPAGTLGASPDEWLSRVDERDRERVELELMTLGEGLSQAFETEYRMRHRDGTLRWMRARGQVDPACEDGRTLVGHQEEVTARRNFEEALQLSESRFRTLIENCPDAIAVHRHGRFLYANPPMAGLLGYGDCAGVVGTLVLESIHPDDYSEVVARIRRLNAGETEVEPPREIRLLQRDGGVAIAEISSLCLNFDGQPAIFAVARDVTERRRMQARLAHADRMVSLGTLAAGVAHEINNPLTYISANLQNMMGDFPNLAVKVRELRASLEKLLGKKRAAQLAEEAGPLLDPTTFQDFLEQTRDAHHGSVRVKSIVTDLRHFTRNDEEKREAVDLARVLETALKMSRHELKFRARIERSLDDVPSVLGDEGRLCQVFVNLLVNAAHAIEPGAVEDNEIRISLQVEGEEVVAEIRDSGSGMPPERLRRIFDPFFTTKPSGVGSGLGLPICQHLIEGHGGRIEVDSEEGRGTRVAVRLPIAHDLVRAEPTEVEAPTEKPHDAAGKGVRILLVDDEPLVGRTLSRSLGAYSVTTVDGGQAAVEILAAGEDFSLILCDLMMLDLSGQEVYGWVVQNRPELAERFVFITGGATNSKAQAFIDQVENIVLEKPVDLDRLQRLVRQLVRVQSPAPRPTLRPERRRGPRYGGGELSGVLEAGDSLNRLTVVDFSVSGLRVAGIGAWPDWKRTTPFALSLHRADAHVQAEVELVRAVSTSGGTDLCFRIATMDEGSHKVYRSWLAAQGGAAALSQT